MPNDRNRRGRSQTASDRGFASKDNAQQRRMARTGGEAVRRDRQHMSELGRRGGAFSRGGGRRRGTGH